jgi:hypothetical protein
MTTIILQGSPAVRALSPGEILTLTSDAASTGRYGRLGDTPGASVPDVPASFTALAASKTVTLGPFAIGTRWLLETLTGPGVAYDQARPPLAHIEIIGDASDVRQIYGAGAPTDGVTGANVAGVGSRYTDTTAGKLYLNGGTKASPAWKIVTSA